MTPHVLVPLRSPGHGKTRLAGALDPDGRARLVAAMLADVVAAVRGAGVPDPVVLADGSEAVDAARALGCAVVDDPVDGGLNGAVDAAVAALPAGDPVLVLLADLPLLTAEDVAAVLAAEGPVVVVATDDGGTSALLRRPGAVIPAAFGEDSAARHRALAHAAGLTVAEVRRPGLARDLDTVEDLRLLDLERTGASVTAVVRGLRTPR